MKKLSFITFLIIILCNFIIGQNTNCPTISVIGPFEIVQPDEDIKFTAEVSGFDKSKVGYKWTVSEGTIAQGQGTSQIVVSIKGLYDNAIKATVEFLNLPAGCPDTASETGIVACRCISVQIDEFGKLPVKEERARLIAAINEAEKNKDDRIYIILKHPSNENKKLNDRIERIKEIFRENKISEDGFVIISGDNEPEERTKIYLVPPGAEMPTP